MEMYGESPEIIIESGDYLHEGGIATFSTRDNSFVGDSSTEGAVYQTARIYWRITQISEGVFEGGITGDDWYFSSPNSPFHDERWNSEQEIWDQAVKENGTLNEVFTAWNALDDNVRIAFLAELANTPADANNCYALHVG